MNPATAMATALVDELVRCGVRHAVLCPGSRSAPLAFALKTADDDGRLTLHVRTDERSAAFVALGLAKGSGTPVPVVTTSGTAVANLHPAVLEASHTGVPLLLLTADRPPELRDTGANQTTRQVGVFGDAVRWDHDLGVPDDRPGQVATWRSVACRAVLASTGARGGWPGPVHLNLPLREPLVPDGGAPVVESLSGVVESLSGRVDGTPWTSVPAGTARPAQAGGPVLPDDGGRTLVLVGDLPAPAPGRTDWGAVAADVADARGWPLVSEPSGAGAWPRALPAGSLLLACEDWVERHRPDRVVVVGRVTLTRTAARLLRDERTLLDVVSDDETWPDPAHRARHVLPLSALAAEARTTAEQTAGLTAGLTTGQTAGQMAGRAPDDWLEQWQKAAAAVRESAAEVLDAAWPSGTSCAAALAGCLPDDAVLVVGSSNPVRDLDLVGGGAGPRVVANRGLAGIDGVLSTATGVALACGRPTYALVGDLTFAHDAAAFQVGPLEPGPHLTVVVVNDDGGGIFTLLEPGEPQHADAFERVFGTPLGLDLASLCGATGTPHVLVRSVDELRAQLGRRPSGRRVLEVRVDRTSHRQVRARLLAAAASAVARL